MALQVHSTKQDKPGPLKVAVYGRMKVGKEQPVTAPVLTPYGYREIGSLQIGDAVIGVNGEPTEVLGVFPQGIKDVYRVSFGDRTATFCGEEHLWAVRTAHDKSNDKPRVLALNALGDLHYTNGSRKFYIPMTAPVQFAGGVKLPLHPYLFGLLLGAGGFRGSSPAFHNPEQDLQRRVQELLPAGLSLQPVQPDGCTRLIVAGPRGGHHGNALASILASLGLWGHLSIQKFIPGMYLLASVEDRLELLRGLIDTDGDIDPEGCTVTFNTSSYRLCQDVVKLLQSLGGTARYSRRTPIYKYK